MVAMPCPPDYRIAGEVQAIGGKWMKMDVTVVFPRPRGRGPIEAVSLHAAVDFFPISDLHHEDEESFVSNLINGAVVLPRPHIDAIELLLGLHLFHSVRAWILLELFDVRKDLAADTRVELLKFPESGVSKVQSV